MHHGFDEGFRSYSRPVPFALSCWALAFRTCAAMAASMAIVMAILANAMRAPEILIIVLTL